MRIVNIVFQLFDTIGGVGILGWEVVAVGVGEFVGAFACLGTPP